MHDAAIKNNEIAKRSINSFLNKNKSCSLGYPVAPIFEVVARIFNVAGKKHLLYLIRLRRYWLEQEDEFLSRHAWPQNLSITWEFTITEEYLANLKNAAVLPKDLLKILQKFKNISFARDKFIKLLNKKLKRRLNALEEELLLEQATFIKKETILHLVVYDGGFTQAIQFKMPAYLKHMNEIIAEGSRSAYKIDRIECHVGDIGRRRIDQECVGKLASVWKTIVSSEFESNCIPAYVQRYNHREASLVLYVLTQATKDRLNTTSCSQQLLKQIYDVFPHLQFVFQKVSYNVRRGMNPQDARSISHILGESAHDPISTYDRLSLVVVKKIIKT